MTDKPRVPSMDDKDTPSPPLRTVAQYEADKRLGVNGPPWPTDKQRGLALVACAKPTGARQ